MSLYANERVPDSPDSMNTHPLNREEVEPDPDEEYDRKREERAINGKD